MNKTFLRTLCLFLVCVTFFSCKDKKSQLQTKPVIGVTWRAPKENLTNSTFSIFKSIEAVGGTYVYLDKVTFDDFTYDSEGKLDAKYVTESGSLTEEAANQLRANLSKSNAKAILGDIKSVIFASGEDVSPTLINDETNVGEYTEEINATRDVSDFLLMHYCLENNINVLGICRGMQVLAAFSGSSLIEDIPHYYETKNTEYGYIHRPEDTRNGDYQLHSITNISKDSHLYKAIRTDSIKQMYSWHHQAVSDSTVPPIVVTAYSDYNGIFIVESIDRTDKPKVWGIQFHPEISIFRMDTNSSLDKQSLEACLAIYRYMLP